MSHRQTHSVEADLWPRFRKLCPGAERIENAVSSGLPDIIYPTYHGWAWCELKLRYATYFYLQKYQLAVAVKMMRLPRVHWPHYVLWDMKRDICQVFDTEVLVKLPRHPYDEKKLRVGIDFDQPWVSMKEALIKLGALG